jgi:replication factor A1
MKVKELQARKPVTAINVEITDISPPREWSNSRGSGRVATARAKDDTGEVSLTLWNDDIDRVKVGDFGVIENGWVSEFKGEKQLSTGRFGKLTIDKSDSS